MSLIKFYTCSCYLRTELMFPTFWEPYFDSSHYTVHSVTGFLCIVLIPEENGFLPWPGLCPYTFKRHNLDLVGWLSWLERCPMYQRVVGLISNQGTYLACGFNPQLRHIQEAINKYFSLTPTFLSLSLPLSKKNQ